LQDAAFVYVQAISRAQPTVHVHGKPQWPATTAPPDLHERNDAERKQPPATSPSPPFLSHRLSVASRATLPALASSAAMPGASASTTAQYAGIGVFVAIVLYYSRSFNSVFLTRRHGANAAAGAGDGDAVTVLPGPVQALGLGPDDVAVLPSFTYRSPSPGRGGGGGLLRGLPRRAPRRRAGAHAAVVQALLPRGVRRRVAAVARDVPGVPGEPGPRESPPGRGVPVAAAPAAAPARGGGVARAREGRGVGSERRRRLVHVAISSEVPHAF